MMGALSKSPKHEAPIRAKGEGSVWLTGAGLCIGLLLVAYFLFLIVSRGIAVFWPDEIVRIELKPESNGAVAGAQSIGGAIVRKQIKPGQTEGHEEWQIFVGNRDAYGFSYKYIDAADIVRTEQPHGVITLKRMEYGDSFGIPVSLKTPEGEVPASAPEFRTKLAAAVKETAARRKRIRQIERTEIGAINEQLNRLTLDERRVAKRETATPETSERLSRERESLQKRYEVLAQEAQKLRADQNAATLVYTLFTGQQQSLSAGNIVSFYFPNDLGLWGKIGVFLRQVWAFLSEDPREANTDGGIFPAIFGTFVMTLLMSALVTPFGVVAAIYLREYAVQGSVVRAVRIAVNNLAGVPSIVFGVFGLGFFVYLVGGTIDQLFFSEVLPTPTFGTGGLLWASLTLALMAVPVVIVSTEEALAAVPRGVREGSLACGASKWQTIQRVVLPASSTGMLTGLVLAMARGAGEVAPLMLVGVVKLAPSLPLDASWPFLHLDRKFMHLGFYIYDLGFQSPDSEAAMPMVFATTLFLIMLVLLLNLSAILIRERLRRKYATGAF